MFLIFHFSIFSFFFFLFFYFHLLPFFIFSQKCPVWARMTGFPSWPARFCSEYEEESFKKKKLGKPGQICVTFLGECVRLSVCLFVSFFLSFSICLSTTQFFIQLTFSIFLFVQGSRCERAWVGETAISEFNAGADMLQCV